MQSGKCDLAIGNTYYMALMMTNEKNPEQKEWAAAVKLLFPNASDRGTHVNVSGTALAKHAPNKANAIKLIEFLASDEAQKIYSQQNNEYPVNAQVEPSDIVKGFGKLKPDTLPLENIAKYRKKASEIMDKVQFDAGPEFLISRHFSLSRSPGPVTVRAICISGRLTQGMNSGSFAS